MWKKLADFDSHSIGLYYRKITFEWFPDFLEEHSKTLFQQDWNGKTFVWESVSVGASCIPVWNPRDEEAADVEEYTSEQKWLAYML